MTAPSLRLRVVEAGARAESLHGFTEETQRLIAEDLLETFLDCLAENADEWQTEIIGIAHALAAPSKAELNRALQVLREDR